MRRCRFEIILGAIVLALFVAVYLWYSPGRKLSHAEVEAYIANLQSGITMPEPDKSEFISRLRTWGEADDGEPTYLANVLRENNPIKPWPGHDIPLASAEATNETYVNRTKPVAFRVGVFPVIAMRMQGMVPGNPAKTNMNGYAPEFDGWSQLNVNRYPSRRAVFDLLTDPAYQKAEPYKFAAMTSYVIPVAPRFSVPDPRQLVGALLLTIFLMTGWIRAARALSRSRHQTIPN